MSISDFIAILRRRWRVIAGTATLVVAGVAVWTALSPSVYQTTATLFISVQGSSNQQDLFLVQSERISSYADLATSNRVLAAAGAELDPPALPSALRPHVLVSQPPSSVLIDISGRDGVPQRAQEIANTVARKTSELAERLETPGGSISPIKVSVAEPAIVPHSRASPKPFRNIIFALVVGLALGLAAGIVREILDNRIKGPDVIIDEFDTPVLATVEEYTKLRDQPLLLAMDDFGEDLSQENFASLWSTSGAVENYRRLRASLQFFDFEDRGRSIMVTSSKPGEGKTTTAGNLAETLVLAGESVVVVDCDLRRPSLANYMKVPGENLGLTNVLIGSSTLDEVLIGGSKLALISSGPIPPNPTELLGTEAMVKLLDSLRARFDVVVVDTPPALVFADASILAPLIGGTILVVRDNFVTRTELERTFQVLATSRAKVSGVVLNMQQSRRGISGYGHKYYYDYNQAQRYGEGNGQKGGGLSLRRVFGRTAGGGRDATPDS